MNYLVHKLDNFSKIDCLVLFSADLEKIQYCGVLQSSYFVSSNDEELLKVIEWHFDDPHSEEGDQGGRV